MDTAPRKVSSGSISSIFGLCRALDVSRKDLLKLLKSDQDLWYQQKEVAKADGVRVVHNPSPDLRRFQRRLNKRVLANSAILVWPHFLYGSLPNQLIDGVLVCKDYVACANVHSGAKSILKVDVKDFYNNVHSEIVKDSLLNVLKVSEGVAEVITRLCTWKGGLVQGALTSSYLANLCLHDLEGSVVERLRRKGMAYTRLVDDITVSSKRDSVDFSYADEIISEMLRSKGLPVNRLKSKCVYSSSESLVVHGLRVAFDSPRLLEDEPRRIRANVKNIEMLAAEGNYRQTHSYRHDFNRCMGRVNKLSRVGHRQHANLMARLKRILPLPSSSDLTRARVAAKRIEAEFASNGSSYGYRKRFFTLQERLNVLARGFPMEATEIRARMSSVRPAKYSE